MRSSKYIELMLALFLGVLLGVLVGEADASMTARHLSDAANGGSAYASGRGSVAIGGAGGAKMSIADETGRAGAVRVTVIDGIMGGGDSGGLADLPTFHSTDILPECPDSVLERQIGDQTCAVHDAHGGVTYVFYLPTTPGAR